MWGKWRLSNLVNYTGGEGQKTSLCVTVGQNKTRTRTKKPTNGIGKTVKNILEDFPEEASH